MLKKMKLKSTETADILSPHSPERTGTAGAWCCCRPRVCRCDHRGPRRGRRAGPGPRSWSPCRACPSGRGSASGRCPVKRKIMILSLWVGDFLGKRVRLWSYINSVLNFLALKRGKCAYDTCYWTWYITTTIARSNICNRNHEPPKSTVLAPTET